MYFKNSKNATHSIFFYIIGVLCVYYIFVTVRHIILSVIRFQDKIKNIASMNINVFRNIKYVKNYKYIFGSKNIEFKNSISICLHIR